MPETQTFGEVIADARKKAGLSQKELALALKKENSESISPQYLNDIEHNRRNPPSDDLIKQLAKLLALSDDYLFLLAGKLNDDLRKLTASPKKVQSAFAAFRRALDKGK